MEFPHIFLSKQPSSTRFSPPSKRGSTTLIPERIHNQHHVKLSMDYDQLWTLSTETRKTDGVYIEFSGQEGFDLVTKSLEDRRAGIRLRNVQITTNEDGIPTKHATIFVPREKRSWFSKKLRQYATEETKTGKPKNDPLIRSIERIQMAILDSFWTDDPSLIPRDKETWCEIWLSNTDKSDLQQFVKDIEYLQIPQATQALEFPDRSVFRIQATAKNLTDLIALNPSLAEFRASPDPVHFFVDLENREQVAWVNDLASRITIDDSADVAICLLDTGVNNGHILLQPLLTDSDLHAYNSAWGVHDDKENPHGTLVSGIAAYGDLSEILSKNDPISIKHRLESVKILPVKGENPTELYGAITAQALSLVEISQPERTHIACMTVTTDETSHRGRPSSWSAVIDLLTSGAEDGVQRLFFISAGNVQGQKDWQSYPHSNYTRSIQDPGQSWNAITVGAYTQKVTIEDPEYIDYTSLAQNGELSPFSTTATMWESSWPFKPDVVFEGGNVAKAPSGFMGSLDDLSLLTTGSDPTVSHFTSLHATSASVALAARMAAQIQSHYPKAWPETVRALLVHSACWPTALVEQLHPNRAIETLNKGEIARLMRVSGYGVPNYETAMHSKTNLLTLVGEYYIQPFAKIDNRYATNEMHLHNLPWPKETLLALGETPVTLRITLSYFIEPGPGEIGKKDKYRYASHGFSFDLNTPSETRQEFLERLNVKARSEESGSTYDSLNERWVIGRTNRSKGSLQSDIWQGTAADLASSNFVGIYPIIGWWRERPWLQKWNKRTRYSLIVSLHTPEEHMDIYTPVAVALKTPVTIDA